jgi:hypothetical protein
MSQTKRTLVAVKRAQEARETARRQSEAKWRAAVLAAREDGHTLQAIADSAGVSRQWVWETIQEEVQS